MQSFLTKKTILCLELMKPQYMSHYFPVILHNIIVYNVALTFIIQQLFGLFSLTSIVTTHHPLQKCFSIPLTSHKLLGFDIPPMNSCIRNWNILIYMFKQLVSYMYHIRLFNTGQAGEPGYSTLKKLSSSHPPSELCPASSPEPNFIVCLCQNAHSDVVDCISNLIFEIAPPDAARSPQFLKKLGFFAKTDVDF